MRAFFWLAAIFGLLGTSLKDVVQTRLTYPLWMWALIIPAVLFAVVFLVFDIRAWHRDRPKRYKTEESINKYMLELLHRGGSAWIFANHLSWVRESKPIWEFITEKAKTGKDIRIFVPRHNGITKDLEASGVKVITYNSLEYDPEARFTLLNPLEPGSSLLAVGRGVLPNFYIEEFSDSMHSRAICVARDLLRTVERVHAHENP